MRSLHSKGRTLSLALTHPNPNQGATVRTAGRLSLLLHPLHRARPVRQAARDDGLRQRRLAYDRAHPLASAAAGTGRRGDAVGSKYPHGQCPSSAPCASSARSGWLGLPRHPPRPALLGVLRALLNARPLARHLQRRRLRCPLPSYQVTGCMYGLSFGIMDVEDAHKGAELRIALQRETRVCYPIGAVAGAFAAVAARTTAGPKCPLPWLRPRPAPAPPQGARPRAPPPSGRQEGGIQAPPPMGPLISPPLTV